MTYKIFHTLAPSASGSTTAAQSAEFAAAWDAFAGVLADLTARSNGFQFYTRTRRTETTRPLSPADKKYVYEAIDVLAFDTFEDAARFREVACKLRADLLGASSSWFLTEERIAVNGAPKGPLDTGPGVRVVTSMRRRRGMQPHEFRKHWDDHARYVVATQGISRYVANPLVDLEYQQTEPPIDGFVEAWFRSVEDLQACFTDPLMTGVQQAHNAHFIDTSSFFTIQCRNREQWVCGRRAQRPPILDAFPVPEG